MGILNNTVSICQFQILGTLPAADLATWVGEGLARNGFRSIEQTSEELSIGWVQLDDYQESGFAELQTFQHDHYLAFSLRQDQRRLPTALLKPYILKAEEDWLAVNPQFKRVPKQQREDLRDAVRGSLFAKTLPVPAIYDAVWDTRSNLVTFGSLGTKTVDLFVEQFKKSFDGLRLVPLHPFARAGQVIDDLLQPALAKTNATGSEAILEQIEANQWLGRDFLLWLMHETMNASSEYSVDQPGPAVAGDGFVAYLNDRLLLASSSETGVQKVTVTGPQDHFNEVRTALQGGKDIHEAVLYLEKQEQLWKMTLKGSSFHFASFKSPAVTLEKDDITDPTMERQAVFFERMYLLEEGLQLFDSLLSAFLKLRLAANWAQKEQAIRTYLAAA
ncbi:MAG: recombination-associated protein RdgC [Desulfuromonadales bacterium]|nr:recombination-associated protein RdgC [Desulfuromonadales bacterium]